MKNRKQLDIDSQSLSLRKPKKGNSLEEKYPEIAKEFDYEKNRKGNIQYIPSDFSYGSSVKVWWKCKNGHSYKTRIDIRTGKNKTKCRLCSVSNRTFTTDDFVKKSKEIYGEERYDYALVEYKNDTTGVRIGCRKHNLIFVQIPNNHYRKEGCMECYRESQSMGLREFINRANVVHGSRYDYSKVVYKNKNTKVKIICKKHGAFLQIPNDHLHHSCGCPKCCSSKMEREMEKVLKYIEKYQIEPIKVETEQNYLGRLRPDFFLSLNNEKIIIEMDGIQHFEIRELFGEEEFEKTQERDKRKNNICNELGIHLLRIDYTLDVDEYLNVVLNFLYEIRTQFEVYKENRSIKRIEQFIGEIYEKSRSDFESAGASFEKE